MKKIKHNKSPKDIQKSPLILPVNNMSNSEKQNKPAANQQGSSSENANNSDKIIYVEKKGKLSVLEKGGIWASIAISLITLFLVGYNISAFNATVKGADISDSTLREIKRQFEIVNRPILQIGDIAFKSFRVGESPVVVYKMENHGNFAAKVLTRRIKVGYVLDINERSKENNKNLEIPIYVSKEIPYTENLITNPPLSQDVYDAVMNGKLKILAMGEIEYINEVTTDTWVYEFVIEIKSPPSKDFTVIVANNKIKPK